MDLGLAGALQQLNEQLEQRIQQATQELEERNRKLQWQSAELIKASQLKTEFLASMSHELRTPLNVVLGYTSLMNERIYGDLNDSQLDALERIHSTSQHLLELISDILDLSKIEAGMMPVNAAEVDVRVLVAELSETIAPIVERTRLALEIDVPADLPPIHTDPVKLKQVLLNLLSNAIKFTPNGGIALRARGRGRHPHRDRGHRHRHSREQPGGDLRGLPSDRPVAHSRVRRDRPRPVHHAQAPRPAGRHDPGAERGGERHVLHDRSSPAARAGRRAGSGVRVADPGRQGVRPTAGSTRADPGPAARRE